MAERQKHPGESASPLDQPPRRPASGAGEARAAARRGDARRSPEQLKQNRERLGVGPEHKTGAMKKGRRGTYP